MMPIVFCASLLPWPMLYSADDSSCSRRNHWSTCRGDRLKKIQETQIMVRAPSSSPSTGEITMNATVLRIPGASRGAVPALARPAPIIPPIRACEELEGMP